MLGKKQSDMSERNSTNFLRVLAIVLVVNSHMDGVYPSNLTFLATGGMIGNALFFMLSALGLMVSMQDRQRAFGEWYARRIIRIYPSVWATILLLVFPMGIYGGLTKISNILDEMGKFFYPPFWFLQALLIYYAAIYFIIRDFSCKRLAFVSIPAITTYVLYYALVLDLQTWSIEQTPFRLIFYFLVVLWGVYLGSQIKKMHFRGIQDVLLLILSTVAIYVHKYLMYKGIYPGLQFVQHLAMFSVLYFAIRVAKSDLISKTLMESKYIGTLFGIVSGATLEIFLVNNSIDFMGPRLGTFPGNMAALISLNVVFAIIVFCCASVIRRKLEASTGLTTQNQNLITNVALTTH